MDYSLPGSSVHGISQARILEWVAISFSRGSSGSGIKLISPAWQVDSSSLSHRHACSVAAVVSDSVRPCGRQPSRLLCPQDSPDKNTRVGCHFPLPKGSPKQLYFNFKDSLSKLCKINFINWNKVIKRYGVWPFPIVMVFGGGAWGKWLGHEGGALMIGPSASDKETPESSLTSLLWRTQHEDSHLWTKKQALTSDWMCWCHDFELPSLLSYKEYISVTYKPSSL